ncbi:hypothetical protein Bpfe_015666 [Biomphalaria pfeifferi]|uniref:F-box domain-containing protein n=1 Tax=Biomphalaria pfeifferi TaxID=112525 RepID=A0AAD8BHR8_BIOPF|nr:hypothetical protein Bpfe_015666 [Biomphalaria pfeifferi]
MPSNIISVPPVDLTRVNAVKPALGLRYGNFDGIKFLPPIQGQETIQDESIWSIQNDQICQRVCQWMEQWRPWQQKTLICGIANRCTLSQLEILSTTLEPLKPRPREYKPKTLKITKKVKDKNRLHRKKKTSLVSTKSDTNRIRTISQQRQISTTWDKSAESLKLTKDNKPKNDVEGNLDKSVEELTSIIDNNKKKTTSMKNGEDKNVNNDGSLLFITDEKGNLIRTAKEGNTTISTESDVRFISVDQYASLLSSSIIVSVFTDITAKSSVIVKNSTSNSEHVLNASKTTNNITSLPQTVNVQSIPVTENYEGKLADCKEVEKSEQNVPCAAGLNKKRKVSTVSYTDLKTEAPDTQLQYLEDSTKFLGGVLDFSSDPNLNYSVPQRSSASHYRYQAFSNSASTMEYFDRRKVSLLGPKQYTSTQMSVRHFRIGSVPVSLQKFYKNSKWWSPRSLSSRPLHQFNSRDLALNFKDQLQTVWKWFDQWESPERITFMKELVLVSSPEVLNSLISNIQQRLNSRKIVNSLPDKLLLYILSFLEPKQIIEASKVCRKWRYLCAREDLWILKCLELGEKEGISNMPDLIQNANQNALGIDWLLAYTQLKGIIKTIRHNTKKKYGDPEENIMPEAQTGLNTLKSYQEKTNRGKVRIKLSQESNVVIKTTQFEDFSELTATNDDDSVEAMQIKDSQDIYGKVSVIPRPQLTGWPKRSKYLKMSTSLDQSEGLLDDSDSVKNKSVRRAEEGTDRTASKYSASHSNGQTSGGSDTGKSETKYSELGNSDFQKSESQENAERKSETQYRGMEKNDFQKRDSQKNAERKSETQKSDVGRDDVMKESIASSNRNVSVHDVSKVNEQEESVASHDILTELRRSKDILGKLVSRTSLEWKSPEVHYDHSRITMYAGKVLALKKMRKIEGHLSSVTCVYFDARRLITCGLDRVIRLWDVRSGRSLHKFLGHKGGIRCVQFDNEILVTGSWDCLIMIWSMRNLDNITTLQGHGDSVTSLEFNADILVSGSADRSIRVWKRPTFYCLHVISFESAVQSLAMCGHMCAVTTVSLQTELIDALAGSRRMKFESPLGVINSLAVHGSLMLGGDSHGRVCFWNIRTGEMEAAVQVHLATIHRVTYYAGRFYTASSDGSIQEWDLKTMTCLRVLKGHTGPVRDVKYQF